MHGFCCQQEEAKNLLAVLAVTASGKAAQITAQMFEPTFAQVGRAQPMSPVCRKGEEGQHLFQFAIGISPPSVVRPTASARRTAAPSPAPALGSPHPRSTRTLAETCAAATKQIAASAPPGYETNAPDSADVGPLDTPSALH